MSDGPGSDAATDELSARAQALHRSEADPRTRSGITNVVLLDAAPDWDRLRHRIEQASRTVPRLRQRVVVPTLPTAAPRWIVDPDFSLDYHLRRVRVPEPATLREVLDVAENIVASPRDLTRPLWTATLVEGVADGQAALITQFSDAITAGAGGARLWSALFDIERDPSEPAGELPQPIPQHLSPADLARRGVLRLPWTLFGGARAAVRASVSAGMRSLRNPARFASIGTARDLVDGVLTATGARTPPAAPGSSPLLRRRSLTARAEAVDTSFADLRMATKAQGCTPVDAFLAGLSGALRRYHRAKGSTAATATIAVPPADDPSGDQRFAAITLTAPLDEADPAECVRIVRKQLLERAAEDRPDESAATALTVLAGPLLALLPAGGPGAGAASGADVSAVDVVDYPGDSFLAGAKVLRQYGLGPLGGVAMSAVFVSRSGQCTVTTRFDQAAVADPGLWAECLRAAFDDVLALGGGDDGPPRCRPASFDTADRVPPGTQTGSDG